MRATIAGLLALGLAVGAALAWLALARSVRDLRCWYRKTLERDFVDNFLFVEPAIFYSASLGLMILVAAVVLLATHNLVFAAVATACAAGLPALAGRLVRRRRARRILQQLPDALELMATSLQAGLALQSALRHLAELQSSPLREELQLIVRKQRLGMAVDAAFEQFAKRVGGSEIGLVVAALALSRRTGGNLSEILRRLARTLRDKQQIERKVSSLTAQGRLQAWIVGLLPMALLLVMQVMEPQAMRLMYSTPVGWAALSLLLALEGTGFVLLRRIMRVDI